MSERVVEVALLQVYTRGRGWVTWERVERTEGMTWDGGVLSGMKPLTRIVLSQPGGHEEAAAVDKVGR